MAGRAQGSSAGAIALWILAVVATLFFLRAAKTLLIPIALAVLISYALGALDVPLLKECLGHEAA